MKKNDKMINGIIAGLAGCLVKDSLTAVLEYFRLSPTYWDYGEYLVFQEIKHSIGTVVTGLFIEILFGLFLGIIFAHLKNMIKTNHPLLRGFVFGMSIWFSTRALITIDHVKILIPHNILMVPANIVIAGLYGLTVSYILEKLECSNKQLP